MRLTLHAGLHKTGSSSIQVFFDTQTKCIEKAGIYYPKDLYVNGAHHPFALATKKGDSQVIHAHLAKWSHSCHEKGLGRILISSEDLEYLNSDGVKLIKTCADRQDLDMEAIIYIRPQSDLVVSQYSQQVREGAYDGSLDAFFGESIAHGDYLKIESMLNSYSTVIGPLLTVRFYYDAAFSPINCVDDICELLQIEEVTKYTDPTTYGFNTKLSAAQLGLICALVKHFSCLQEMDARKRGQVLYQFIEGYAWPDSYSNGSRPELCKDQVLLCMNQFMEENARISEKYLGNRSLMQSWYLNRMTTLGDVRKSDNNSVSVDCVSEEDLNDARAALSDLISDNL